HRQERWRWNVDAAAALDRFDEDGANPFAAEEPADDPFDGSNIGGLGGKLHEVAEFAKLGMERAAEKFPMRGVERAVAKAVVSAGESDDSLFTGGEQSGFERGFDGFKTGIAKNDLARFF